MFLSKNSTLFTYVLVTTIRNVYNLMRNWNCPVRVVVKTYKTFLKSSRSVHFPGRSSSSLYLFSSFFIIRQCCWGWRPPCAKIKIKIGKKYDFSLPPKQAGHRREKIKIKMFIPFCRYCGENIISLHHMDWIHDTYKTHNNNMILTFMTDIRILKNNKKFYMKDKLFVVSKYMNKHCEIQLSFSWKLKIWLMLKAVVLGVVFCVFFACNFVGCEQSTTLATTGDSRGRNLHYVLKQIQNCSHKLIETVWNRNVFTQFSSTKQKPKPVHQFFFWNVWAWEIG